MSKQPFTDTIVFPDLWISFAQSERVSNGTHFSFTKGSRKSRKFFLPLSKNELENFDVIFHKVEGDPFFDMGREFLIIFYIAVWSDDMRDIFPFCRQNFFLETADRQNLPFEGDFSRHSDVRRNGLLAHQRNHRSGKGNTR